MPSRPPGPESDLEQLDEPVVLVAARQVVYANMAAHRLFGVVPGSLKGQGLERLVVVERRGELRNIDEVLRGGSARRVRSALRREDGGRVDVSLEIEPYFDDAGALEGACVRYEVIAGSGRMSVAPLSMHPRGSLRPLGSLRPSLGASAAPRAQQDPESNPRIILESDSYVIRGESDGEVGSGARKAPTPPLDSVASSLAQVKKELDWLEERLALSPSVAPLDDSRERARALLVLVEAREHLLRAQEELEASRASLPPFPGPPRLPSL